MKRSHLPYLAATVLSIAILPALNTHAAALIDLGVGAYGSDKTNVNASVDTGANSVNANADVNANANADTDTSTSNTNSTSAGLNSSVTGAINSSAHVFDEGESVQVLRHDLDSNTNATASENANANGVSHANANSAISPSAISSSSDLKAYASDTMQSDANIDEMNFTKDAVEVGYKEHGKLLGIFPVIMTLKAKANADGSVKIDYPWYSFMVAKDRADLEAKLNAAVSESMNAGSNGTSTESMVGSSTASFNASEAAEIASRMHQVLMDAFNSSASADASANASSSGSASY